ncbi:L,D-transpeptidase [Sporolactobacillus kofuensis]|uniref:L,D-transpeptidase n=1 Tax=Sporolactobacillus kofuensis TaxID=269672 RepID=A0ABW1WFJ2_9BACL|nr:L,D-transpeptidase family protein [Sporolactobacillus kofuensis]MCO7174812.1 L,D-transpeptidase family protein [Sporolactobacillus kofuensis]
MKKLYVVLALILVFSALNLFTMKGNQSPIKKLDVHYQISGRTYSSKPSLSKTKLSKRTKQILLVIGKGSHAQIQLWQKKGKKWSKNMSTNGHVGKDGIGKTHEGSMKTPYGAYKLTFAFGTSNPGTKLPFRHITPNSWWVEDSNDPNYNTWQEGSFFNKPSEHLINFPVQYKYGIVINYNAKRTPWKGSGFFVHVSNGSYTAGCVSVPRTKMKYLMRTIKPGAYILNITNLNQLKHF